MVGKSNLSKIMNIISAKKNFLFQMLYQIVTLVIPLIIAPYLTRTLGDSSLGIYTYTYSIMYCFMSIARLGIDKHGQRLIAASRDNNEKLRTTFWSLYTVHIVFSLLSLFLYIIFINLFCNKYRYVFIIQGLALFGVVFDVTWYFYGIENFKLIVLENICVKITELLLIFLLVKNTDSLVIYVIIMSLSICIGYIIVLPYVIKNVKPIRFTWDDVKQHFKPLFVLFIAVIATTIYQMIDKTLLGVLSTEANVAYYEYANKIVNVPVNLIYVMGTVLMPRACSFVAKKDNDSQKMYMNYSLHFVCFLGFGSIFGLLAVSNLFSIIYYGNDFAYCGDVIRALCPVIYFLGVENIIRTQYMIPNHMDKQFSACILITALVNLFLSYLLIPIMGVYGAVIGSIVAEIICSLIQMILCRSFISLKTILGKSVPYFIFGFIMYFAIQIIKNKFNRSFFDLLLQIGIGSFCYILFSGAYIFLFSDIKENMIHEIKKLKVN